MSTCKKAKEGALIAAEAIKNLYLKKGDWFFDFDDKTRAEHTVSHILYELQEQSKEDGIDVSEYSSTIAAVLLDKRNHKIMTFNLGDSLILGAKGDKITVIGQPSDTSYGTPTTTTKNAHKLASTRVIEPDYKAFSYRFTKSGETIKSGSARDTVAKIDSVVICSDGAWRAMYNRNKIKTEIKEMIVKGEYEALNEYLTSQNTFDDCSFVVLSDSKTMEKTSQGQTENERKGKKSIAELDSELTELQGKERQAKELYKEYKEQLPSREQKEL